MPRTSPRSPLGRRRRPLGDFVHILLRHAVHVDHVPAHVVDHAEGLLAHGTRRLAGVHLEVLDNAAPVAVEDAADGTRVGPSRWKHRGIKQVFTQCPVQCIASTPQG